MTPTRPILRYHGGKFRMAPWIIQHLPAHRAYVDPPYVLGTRQMAGRCYRYEMTDAQHGELLDCLMHVEGMVALSGYSNPVYDNMLQGWQRIQRRSSMASQRGSDIRAEVLWLSPNIPAVGLFAQDERIAV